MSGPPLSANHHALVEQQLKAIASEKLDAKAIKAVADVISGANKGPLNISLRKTSAASPLSLSARDLRPNVEWICDYLEAHGVWVEGLLRHSALASERDALFGLIVLHPELLANNYLFQRCSVHALASVLKKLVSSAEPSLLPECFSDEMSEEQLKKEVTIAIQKQPCLHRLLLFLSKMSNASSVTKMNAHSLAVCIAQALMHDEDLENSSHGGGGLAASAVILNRNVARLIENFSVLIPQPYQRESTPMTQAVGHCMFLKEEEWFEMIQKFSVTVACQKGDILISMKEPNPNLYRVQSGRFSLHRSDGKPFKFVGPGGVFGVVSLFDTESSSVADVVSESVGEVAVFRHEDIERMKSSNPQLAVKLFRHLALELTNVLVASLEDPSKSTEKLLDKIVAPSKAASVSQNSVFRCKFRGMWGSLILNKESVSHHGSFLGSSRSTIFMLDQLGQIALNSKTVRAKSKNDQKELKFKFANDLEAKRFSEILGKSCAEPILSLDHLKLSQSSVHDVINFNYVTVATVDFKDYGQTCLDLRKGERVVIGERKGTWVAATTVDRRPAESGWVPIAILADSGIHMSENKVMGNILKNSIEKVLNPWEDLMHRGDVAHAGHLMVVSHGELLVQRDEMQFHLFQDQLVGEVTFLRGGTPTASVIAGPEGAIVQIVRPAVIDEFLQDPQNALSFFLYLCSVLAARTKSVFVADKDE